MTWSRFLPVGARSLLFLVGLLTFALPSCWYAGHANGTNGNFYFRSSVVAGTNLPVSIEFNRYPDQWQSICSTTQSSPPLSGTVRPLGGGCDDPLNATPIALLDAHCDDGACTVQDASADAYFPGAVRLVVTPARAGTITLHVKARAKDGSGSWDDTLGIPVEAVAKLAFFHYPEDDAVTTFAVLPGTPVAWEPRAYAADGRQLDADPTAFSVTWDAGAVGPGPDGKTLSALAVGTGTATLRAAGKALQQSVQVVDPANAVAMEVRRKSGDYSVDFVDTNASPTKGGAVSEIVVDYYANPPYVLVLTMADGTRALGGVSSLTVSVDSVEVDVAAARKTLSDWTFSLSISRVNVATDGTLTGKVGSAELIVPVRGPPASVADGGSVDGGSDDAALDAGNGDE